MVLRETLAGEKRVPNSKYADDSLPDHIKSIVGDKGILETVIQIKIDLYEGDLVQAAMKISAIDYYIDHWETPESMENTAFDAAIKDLLIATKNLFEYHAKLWMSKVS